MWTRKRTVIGGQTAPDDWAVFRRGQAVGRVYRGNHPHIDAQWRWATRTYPCDSGRALTLDQALDQMRAAIRARWPDDVDRLPVG